MTKPQNRFMRLTRILKYAVIVALVGTVAALWPRRKTTQPTPPHPRDYAEIAQEGVLRATTEYNSISFYVDGDTIDGFHYELIQAFAREHGLQADITPEMSFEKRLSGLAEGRYDLIATSLLATSELKDSLLLTQPIVLAKEVLVQRKPTTAADSASFVRSLLDLAGKTVHVVKGSPSTLRIRNLAQEIGDTIGIHEIAQYGDEQLIALVAHGDLNYVVCDENIARIAADSLPQIDISTAVSFTQFYAWGVSKQSPALADSLNAWLARFLQSEAYRQIHRKYY